MPVEARPKISEAIHLGQCSTMICIHHVHVTCTYFLYCLSMYIQIISNHLYTCTWTYRMHIYVYIYITMYISKNHMFVFGPILRHRSPTMVVWVPRGQDPICAWFAQGQYINRQRFAVDISIVAMVIYGSSNL